MLRCMAKSNHETRHATSPSSVPCRYHRVWQCNHQLMCLDCSYMSWHQLWCVWHWLCSETLQQPHSTQCTATAVHQLVPNTIVSKPARCCHCQQCLFPSMRIHSTAGLHTGIAPHAPWVPLFAATPLCPHLPMPATLYVNRHPSAGCADRVHSQRGAGSTPAMHDASTCHL